jgi:signal transduction histidine kinase
MNATLSRSHLERALERSEARFRDVIERNPDAIVVVDRQGIVCFANHVAERLFGGRLTELAGSSFGFPLLAGETTELDLVRDGQPRVVEMRVVESEWDGEPACIASLRDITERKQAEEVARRLVREQAARSTAEAAARRFRFLAESGAALASSLDEEETLAQLARSCVAELADWAVMFIVEDGGVRRLEVVHRDAAKRAAARALRDEKLMEPHPALEVVRTRKSRLVPHVDDALLHSLVGDAQQRALVRTLGIASFMIVPLIARDRILGAIGLASADPARAFGQDELALAEDLALRAALALDNARLYRAANEANRAKLELLAVVSHDLRTPLNSIIGHAQLLAMGIPEALSDGTRARVERIHIAAQHLLYLIDQLLAFARLDAGREELHFTETDVSDVIADAAAVMEPLASERGLRLTVETPPAPVLARTDPDKLRQVVLNLIGNAVKYTERGEVRVRAMAAEDGAQIEVRDTGVGIAAEHLEDIFKPFWQVDPSRSRSGGTGLGLSVVKRLVDVLGGAVKVESVVGAGSVFVVTLPRRLTRMAGPRVREGGAAS